MLAACVALGADHRNYTAQSSVIQRLVARTMSDMCLIDFDTLPVAVDGCSVPTWAIPIDHMAIGYSRLAAHDDEQLSQQRRAACARIIAAVRRSPHMVAGNARFCTRLMSAVPRVFVKTGAEGVFIAAIEHAGIGVCVKIDDGASRASGWCSCVFVFVFVFVCFLCYVCVCFHCSRVSC